MEDHPLAPGIRTCIRDAAGDVHAVQRHLGTGGEGELREEEGDGAVVRGSSSRR